MRWLIISFMVAAAASAVAAFTLGPESYMDAILHTPQGLVVVGRVMMVYSTVYPATGNPVLTAFAAIVFNNASGLAAALSAPPLIHSSYRARGRAVRFRLLRLALWPRRLEWGFCRRAIALIAVIYVASFGALLSAVLAFRGPALFMPLEAGYVFLAAAAVYRSSQAGVEGFGEAYGRVLRRVLPAIIALLVVAAAVEAYETV
jgi:hypothetical protein